MRRSLPAPRFRATATGGKKIASRIKINLFTIVELRGYGTIRLAMYRVDDPEAQQSQPRKARSA